MSTSTMTTRLVPQRSWMRLWRMTWAVSLQGHARLEGVHRFVLGAVVLPHLGPHAQAQRGDAQHEAQRLHQHVQRQAVLVQRRQQRTEAETEGHVGAEPRHQTPARAATVLTVPRHRERQHLGEHDQRAQQRQAQQPAPMSAALCTDPWTTLPSSRAQAQYRLLRMSAPLPKAMPPTRKAGGAASGSVEGASARRTAGGATGAEEAATGLSIRASRSGASRAARRGFSTVTRASDRQYKKSCIAGKRSNGHV